MKDIAAIDVDYKKLATLTKGYVSKDICVLVNRAALVTAQQDDDFIKMQTLLDVIEKNKGELPSVTQSVLREHERIRDEFESGNKTRPIGFTTQKDTQTWEYFTFLDVSQSCPKVKMLLWTKWPYYYSVD